MKNDNVKFKIIFFLIIFFSIFGLAKSSWAALWSGVLDPNRAIDWSQPGVRGGIPNRTTICANVKNSPYNAKGNGITNDGNAIQSALDNCPENQVVYLPPGSYLTEKMIIVPDSVTLRGAGPKLTEIISSDWSYAVVGTQGQEWNYLFNPDSISQRIVSSILGGAIKGSTSITVASNPGIKAGDILHFSRIDDGSLVNPQTDQGWVYGCVVDAQGRSRCLGQLAEVTQVNGNTVSFAPGLFWDYPEGLSPTITVAPGSAYVSRAGIEDLKVRLTREVTDQYSIAMGGSRDSWVKNIEVQDITMRGLWMTGGFHNEVRDSYFHDGPVNNQQNCGRNRAYGIALDLFTTNTAVENNILKNLDGDMIFTFGGASGNVIGYNFMTSPCFYDDNWLSGSPGLNHGSHPMMNLWEGNIGVGIASDILQGSSSHNTIYRSYSPGWTNTQNGDKTPTNNSVAVMIEAHNRYVNVVGSVIGKSGWTDGYEDIRGGNSSADHPIWLLGYAGGTGTVPDDSPTVAQTLYRKGNFDFYHNCVWSDASGKCLTTAEVSGLSFPPSLYLSGKPSWFGSAPWPPIGPDVSSYYNKIPAQIRYENEGASDTTPPASPVNLTAQ